MPRASKGLIQAYQMQDLAFNMAQALRESMTDESGNIVIKRDEYGKPCDPPAFAQIGKVWQTAQERIAFHRRVPSPGSMRPVDSPARRRAKMRAPDVMPLPLPPQDVSEGAAS